MMRNEQVGGGGGGGCVVKGRGRKIDEQQGVASNMAVGPTYCLFRAVNGWCLQLLKHIMLNWPGSRQSHRCEVSME
jgi:hypothetical protein